MAIFKQISVM